MAKVSGTWKENVDASAPDPRHVLSVDDRTVDRFFCLYLSQMMSLSFDEKEQNGFAQDSRSIGRFSDSFVDVLLFIQLRTNVLNI